MLQHLMLTKLDLKDFKIMLEIVLQLPAPPKQLQMQLYQSNLK